MYNLQVFYQIYFVISKSSNSYCFFFFFFVLITVFLLRFSSGLAATLLLWPVITEQIHLSRKVHLDANYACPTAKTGLLGGGAFLSLDSCLFWLVALMLADNAREDHFEENKTFEDASVAI